MIWPELEPEYFKKLEWSRSWHKLVQLQAPTIFKNFVKKIMISDIILQAKKLIFWFCSDPNTFSVHKK